MFHLNRISERAMSSSVPMSVNFEITGRCNLDCTHCYLDIAHPTRELDTAQALQVVEQIAEAGCLFLVLTGGEIFLRKDTLTIARHARSLGMAVRLFTNATRIDRKLAAEIAEVGPLAVEVSLYGADAKHHDGVTNRRRSLRRTLRGVLHLRNAGVRVGLKTPVFNINAAEAQALIALADRIGATMAFDPLVTARLDGNERPLQLRPSSPEQLASVFALPRLRDTEVGAPGCHDSEPGGCGDHSMHGATVPVPADDDVPCGLARSTARVSANGDLYPCSTYPTPLGNVLETRFAELWRAGELVERLRAIRMRDLRGDCGGCAQSGYCGRCTAVALIEHGDELGPSRESCRVATAKEIAFGYPMQPRKGAAATDDGLRRLPILR